MQIKSKMIIMLAWVLGKRKTYKWSMSMKTLFHITKLEVQKICLKSRIFSTMNITIGSAIHPVIHYKKMESELMIYSKETSIQIQKSRKTKNTKKMSVKRRMSSLAIAMLKQICQYITKTKTTLEIKKKWKGMKEETKQ